MNLLKDIGSGALQVLKTIAPTIAAAASGPFAPLAVPLVAKVFGTDPNDPKAAQAALLTATPDQLLALKKAEQDFQVQMKQLGIAEAQLTFNDLASARQMQQAWNCRAQWPAHDKRERAIWLIASWAQQGVTPSEIMLCDGIQGSGSSGG